MSHGWPWRSIRYIQAAFTFNMTAGLYQKDLRASIQLNPLSTQALAAPRQKTLK